MSPISKLRERAPEIFGEYLVHVAKHRTDGIFHVYVRMYLESEHITKLQENYEIINVIPSGKEDDKIIGKHSSLILLVKEKETMTKTNIKKCNFELSGNFPILFEKHKPKELDDSLYIKNMVISWLINRDLKNKPVGSD